jgi:hypothetical protein
MWLTDILGVASNPDLGSKSEGEMKNFIRLFSFIAVIALVLLSPLRSDTRQSSRPAAPYEHADAYEVYSAVLSMGGPWEDSKSLVILQDLPPKDWPIGSPPDALHGNAAFRKQFDSIFRSFEQMNRQALSLENHFSLQKPYQIVGSAELEAAFHRTEPGLVHDGWEGFRQSFPNSSGYLILSAVGFNAEKTMAVVFVDYRCGGLCASARYYILEKRDGRWVNCIPKGLQSETRGNS